MELSAEQLNKFQTYHQTLLTWNKKINLISRKDTARIVSYHFIDAISVVPEIPKNATVLDLGTGAGLPGIPVKIIREDITLFLVESIKKKGIFLSEIIKLLDLKNTFLIIARAETITDKLFDVILIRLLGKISEVLPIAANLLSPDGKIIFFKTEYVEQELIKAQSIINKYHLHLSAIKNVPLPGAKILRKFVIFTRRDEK
ncbi:MAG: 16S rRNA (guanine(527)-N(7))-methyltransferase RsmG [candidate division WOR-3 bacterium]